jgi:hypothetical protein
VPGAGLVPKFSTEKATVPPPPATRLELTSAAAETFKSEGLGVGDDDALTVIVEVARLLEFPALSNAITAISSVPDCDEVKYAVRNWAGVTLTISP